MAVSARTVPSSFPSNLGHRLLKAEALRQISGLRQEVVTEVLSILADTLEPIPRKRLLRLAEAQLRAGLAAADKASVSWPSAEEAREEIAKQTEAKPAAAKKHLRTFEQLDRLHQRSLALLESSFENARLILDRLQPAPAPEGQVNQQTMERHG